MKNNCNSIKSVIFQMSLILSIMLFIMSPAQYVQAGDDIVVLGCFITLRGEITCSDTGMAPEQTKISVFDANSSATLVKEVVVQGGTYELNLEPGNYRVYFASEGYTTKVSEVLTISRETSLVYDVVLAEGTAQKQGNIVFTLIDEMGAPYSNCELALSYYEDNHRHNITNPLYTDENGRCLIYWDLVERNYSLSVYDAENNSSWMKSIKWDKADAVVVNDGYLPNEYYNLTIVRRRDVASEPIESGSYYQVLDRNETDGEYNPLYGSVCGRMIDHKGRYFNGFDVIARRISVDDISLVNDGNDTDAHTMTDKTGNWELELEPGKYQITCWGASYSTEHIIVDVYENKLTMVGDVVINSSTQGVGYKPITIKVQNVLTGEPIPNALIYFRQNWNTKSGNVYYMRPKTWPNGNSEYQFYTDADGVMEASGIRSQEYCVEISAPGYRTGHFNVVCCENEEPQYCCLAPY